MKLVDKIVKEEMLLFQVLKSFYGFGYHRSSTLCMKFGIPFGIKMGALTQEHLDSLEVYLRSYEYYSRDILIAGRKALIFHKKRGDFRGIRLGMGLPVRGQQAHTNASTVYKLFKGMKKV